jgi:hypothetical protein
VSNRARYEHEIKKAKTMFNVEPDKPDYWRGYILGLMRSHYGDEFCTPDQHNQWSLLVNHPDESQQQLGKGYMDGLIALVKNI